MKFMAGQQGKIRWLAIAAMALVGACGPAASTQLRSIAVDPSVRDVAMGELLTLHAIGTFADGHTEDVTQRAEWTSSNSSVVTTLAARGVIRGAALGTATITATMGSIAGTGTLRVTDARVVRLELTPATPPDLPSGMVVPFTAFARLTDDTMRDVTTDPLLRFTSSNTAVATISNDRATEGFATGVAEGVTNIGATYTPTTGLPIVAVPVALHVTGVQLRSIEIDPPAPTVPANFSVQLRLIGHFADRSTLDITGSPGVQWSSDAPAIATISGVTGSAGLASGVMAGTAVIRAQFGTQSATATIRVTDATLASIAIAPAEVTVMRGGRAQLRATGIFSDMSTMDLTEVVTWESGDTTRVTVSNTRDSAGLATVLATAAPGDVQITARRGAIGSHSVVHVNMSLVLQRIDATVDPSIVPVGLTAQARAVGTYSDGLSTFQRDITELATWSGVGTATVLNTPGSHGLVVGNSAGVASISATLDGVSSAIVPVTVTGCAFNALRIVQGAAISLPRGTSRQLTLHALYDASASGCESLGASFYDVTQLGTTAWNSSNNAVANVSNAAGTRGLVRAWATPMPPGWTDIQATYRSLMAMVRVTVTDACVMSIRISGASNVLPAGVETPLTAYGWMSDTRERPLGADASWSSSDNSIVSVDSESGIAHATRPGTADIMASVAPAMRCPSFITNAMSMTVSGATITGVSVEPVWLDLSRGENASMRALGTFSDMRTYDVTGVAAWRSSNPTVATVASGRVQAAPSLDGTAIVTAAFGSRDGFATVRVSGARLQRIVIGIEPTYDCGTNSAGAFPVGAEIPLAATGFYSDMTSRRLSGLRWRSDSADILIDPDRGIVRPAAAGTANIRGSLGGVDSELFVVAAAAAVPSGLLVSPASGWTLPIGSQLAFRAAVVYAGFSGSCPSTSAVRWVAMATPPAGLTVDAMGLATATTGGPGPASVRAELGPLSAVSAGVIRGTCVDGMTVEPRTLSTPVGIRADVVAFLNYSDGSRVQITADWSSSDAAIARVFNATDDLDRPVGRIAPLAVGLATVQATFRPTAGSACSGRGPVFTADSAVTVTGEVIRTLAVDCANDATAGRCNFAGFARPSYPVGLAVQCRAYAVTTGGNLFEVTESVSWSSTRPDFLQVSDSAGTRGRIRGLAGGAAVVVATASGFSAVRPIDVSTAMLSRIDVTPNPLSLPSGFVQQFSAEAEFALAAASRRCNVTRQTTWSSSAPAVADVSDAEDTRGIVRTLAASATPVSIQATLRARTGSASLTVNSATLSAIEVSPATATAGINVPAAFSATGRYSDGSARDVTNTAFWSTGDVRIAVISSSWPAQIFALALATGTTVIRAEIGGLLGEGRLTVTPACVQELTIGNNVGRLNVPANVPVGFSAWARYSDNRYADVSAMATWFSSDSSVLPTPTLIAGLFQSTTRAVGAADIIAYIPTCTALARATAHVVVSGASLMRMEVRGESGSDSVPINRTGQYRAYGYYDDFSMYDLTVAVDGWAIANPTVATISVGGLVTGRSVGTTTATATQGAISSGATVNVTGATLDSIRVLGLNEDGACRDDSDPASYISTGFRTVAYGQTRVRAYGVFSDLRVWDITNDVTWTTDNAAAATVNNGLARAHDGIVTTHGAGTARIGASIRSGAAWVQGDIALDVRAGTLASITIDPLATRPIRVAAGDRHQFSLVGDYGAAGRFCVASWAGWGSSMSSVAAVDNGLLTAVAVGTTTVTAWVGPLSDTVVVNVGAPTLSFVELTPSTLTLSRFSTARLRALAHYSDGTIDDVSMNPGTLWSARDVTGSGVMWVDPGTFDRGLIWALNGGQARVDACVRSVCASTGTPDRTALITVTP